MAFKANGPDGQGGAGQDKAFVATHTWRSQNFDFAVALTGKVWHDEASDRDFAEVMTADGLTRPVPKDELVAKSGKRAKQATSKLSPGDAERLRTWMPEIADEALGEQHEEGDGSFRFGSNRGLIIHPSGFWYDFTSDRGGTGGVDLLALLHRLKPADAIERAQEWLRAHSGFGSLADEVEDLESSKAAGEAERIAFINALSARTIDIAGTAGWTYLTTARGLSPEGDDLKHIRWLPHARGNGSDAEGAMVVALTNNAGGVEAIQLTHVTTAGVKSEIKPCRRTYKGAHDWGRRGLLRLGPAGSSKAFIVEGVEDGLTLRQAGAERVLVLCGLYRLGKVTLPFEIETAAVVRDADEPEAAGTAILWRGVVRLACQLHSQAKLLVTTRPDAIGAKAKDANDLIRLFGVDKVQALMASAQKIPPFSEFERKAIIEAACDVDNAAYANGRDRIASLLEWRKADLDKARLARIKERANANSAALSERDQPWPDPVLDIAPLLDEIVIELSRYVVAPLPMLHTVALWIVFAHLVHREELKINISPRLAIQAPDIECGKSVLMEAISCGVPRPDLVGSTTASSVFRSIQSDKPTLLIDEVDLLLANGRNLELHEVLNTGHRRSGAWVRRVDNLPDGSHVPTRYNCFTAIATAGIKELPRSLQNRSIVVFLQRAIAGEVREHLVDGESEALITVRRKLLRWAEDLRELPDVNRPRELANRKGDNWHLLRRIAALAGDEWKARALEAATGSTSASPPTSTGALTELLDAIWRVFAASNLERMLTQDIVAAMLDLDEDKWRYVNNGKPVNPYYLRDLLKDVIPRSTELDRARRWKPSSNPKGNPQWGYAKAHLTDAWLRYLAKNPPGEEDGEQESEETGPAATPETPTETPEPNETAEKQENNQPRGARARGRRKP